MSLLRGIKGACDRVIEAATLHWSLVPGVASAPQTPNPRPQHSNPQTLNPQTLALGDLVRRASKPRPQVPDCRRLTARQVIYTLMAATVAGVTLVLLVQHAVAVTISDLDKAPAQVSSAPTSSAPISGSKAQDRPSGAGEPESATREVGGQRPAVPARPEVVTNGTGGCGSQHDDAMTAASIALAALQRRQGITYTHVDGEELPAGQMARTRILGAMEPQGSRPTWARATGITDEAEAIRGDAPRTRAPKPHIRRNI